MFWIGRDRIGELLELVMMFDWSPLVWWCRSTNFRPLGRRNQSWGLDCQDGIMSWFKKNSDAERESYIRKNYTLSKVARTFLMLVFSLDHTETSSCSLSPFPTSFSHHDDSIPDFCFCSPRKPHFFSELSELEFGMLSVEKDFIVSLSHVPRSLARGGLKNGMQAHRTPRRASRDVRSAMRQYVSSVRGVTG